MTLKEYLEKRQGLMNNAEAKIAEGDVVSANAIMEDVNSLDAEWSTLQDAQAAMNALRTPTNVNLADNSVTTPAGSTVIASGVVEDDMPTYETAWAHAMMGQPLTDLERQVMADNNPQLTNEFTHTTANTAILIPTTVVAGIFKRAEGSYPLFGDARKFNVRGKLSFKKHVSIDAGDAAWYEEGTDTADEKNTFGELVLDGKELSKAVTVSWKLKAMSVPDFIDFITKELADRCGVALGTSAHVGNGTTEPEGVKTALLAESGTPQIVDYTGNMTYASLTSAMAKVASTYLNGSAWYANSQTIWNKLANILDGQGRPIFIPDTTAGGVGRIFGLPVKADDGAQAGDVVMGNPGESLVVNTNEPFSVTVDQHAKQRVDDYVAYAVVDGGVLDTKAFALLREVEDAGGDSGQATPPEEETPEGA